jgi:hypothetical protein
MPGSAATQQSLAIAAAAAISKAKIPGVLAAREMYRAVSVEVSTQAWQSGQCSLLAAVAQAALLGSGGVLLPIDIRAAGPSRFAITVVDGGSSMKWQVLK